jgi:hypothetical protein
MGLQGFMTETAKPAETTPPATPGATPTAGQPTPAATGAKPKETGGPKGLEPTRYGDWEKNGRCIDF